MLHHVVLLRFLEGTTEAQRQALAEGLAALPAAIEEVRSFAFGADLGLVDGTWDWAIHATFDDADAWRRYQAHPAHVAVVEQLLRPVLAERAAVQHAE